MLCLLPLFACADSDGLSYFDIKYDVTVNPQEKNASVTIELKGEKLPSKMVFHIDSKYHQFSPQTGLTINKDAVTWLISGSSAKISYQYQINHPKGKGRYDAYINDRWAIFRSDKLIPPISSTASKRITSTASLEFHLPQGWSSEAPYSQKSNQQHSYTLTDPGRRIIRPKGWLILGELASRQDVIKDINVRVASPSGKGLRLQDTLTFINIVLPQMTQVFPDFPKKLLVIQAGEPMWLGGLSGTASLFMHSDRPLISGNRTSSLIHELVHVAMSISADSESDWIVEGIAEFYALELLHRAGGISDRRYKQSLVKLQQWGENAPSLLVGKSSAAVTARAANLFYSVDQQIRHASGNKASLDNVVRVLSEQRGEVNLSSFASLVNQVAGKDIKLLDRASLSQP
jgi:hypothetical protein